MTTLDESIHCLAAPSLQRLFQVLEGGSRNPKLVRSQIPVGQIPEIVLERKSEMASGAIY